MYQELENYIGQQLTYKKICEILHIEPKTGNTKISQIKDISRYYKIAKEKTKFVIEEKYNIPLENENIRNTKYGNDIETILLYKLQEEEDNIYECTVNQALLLCKMVNENYSVGRGDIPNTSKVLELEEYNVYDFYDKTTRQLRNAFEITLDRMRNKALLSYEKRTKVVYKNVNIKTNEFGEYCINAKNELTYVITETHEYATEEEREIILECESYALNYLDCQSKKDVFLKKKWNDYKDLVNTKLLERCNIKYYYEVYNIVINKAQVGRVVASMENDFSKNNLNNTIVDSLFKALDKKEKNVDENILSIEEKKRAEKTIMDNKKMINTVIKPTNIDLRFEIKEYQKRILKENKKQTDDN